MADKEYIEREAIFSKIVNTPFGVNCSGETEDYKQGMLDGLVKKQHNVLDMIQEQPAADVVSRSVFEQVKWERDMAMEQLKDHKIPFGCIAPDVVEVVRCKECKSCFIYTKWNGTKYHGCCFGGEIYEVEPTHFCSYGERKE